VRDFSSDQGAEPQEYREYFKVWQRGALRKRSAFDAEGLSPRLLGHARSERLDPDLSPCGRTRCRTDGTWKCPAPARIRPGTAPRPVGARAGGWSESDPQARARINARILRLSFGNPGKASTKPSHAVEIPASLPWPGLRRPLDWNSISAPSRRRRPDRTDRLPSRFPNGLFALGPGFRRGDGEFLSNFTEPWPWASAKPSLGARSPC